MATEETARLATRIDGIEQTLMVQSGALSAAKDQAEAHRGDHRDDAEPARHRRAHGLPAGKP